MTQPDSDLRPQAKFRTYHKQSEYPPALPRYSLETVKRTQRALEPMLNASAEHPPPWLKEHTPTEAVAIMNASHDHVVGLLSALDQNKKRGESLKNTLARLDDRIWSLLERLYDVGNQDMIDLIENSATSALYIAYSRSYDNPEEWVDYVKGTRDIDSVPKPVIDVATIGTSYLAWEGLSGYPNDYPEYSQKPNPYGHLYSLYDMGFSNARLTDEDKQNQLVLSITMEKLTDGKNVKDVTYAPDVIKSLIKRAA